MRTLLVGRRGRRCSTSCWAFRSRTSSCARRSRFKGLLIALSLAPLLASVVVRTYGWYIILNRFGVANDTLLDLGIIERSHSVHAQHRRHRRRPRARAPALRRAVDHGLAQRHQSQPRVGRDEPRRQPHAHVLPRRAAAVPARHRGRVPARVLDRDQRVRHAGDPRRAGDAGGGHRDLQLHRRCSSTGRSARRWRWC